MPRSCGTCVYFEPIVMFDSGEPDAAASPESICRRFPPTDGWPTVLADDWCGEFKPTNKFFP